MLPEFELLEACKNGTVQDAVAALDRGVSPLAKPFGKSLLRVAADKGHVDIVRLLLLRGADPNEQIGDRRNSHLHYATNTENYGFVYSLLERGADPNISNSAKATPLHLACRHPGNYLVKRLLEAKSDPNARDVGGNTPLQLAVEKSNLAVCKLLVSYGADVNSQNDKGITPYYIASKNGNEEIAEYLRQSGADVSKMPHHGNSRKNRIPKTHRQLLIDFELDADPANSEFASIVAEGRHDNPSGNRSR